MIDFRTERIDPMNVRVGLIKRRGFDTIPTPTRAVTSFDISHMESLKKVDLFRDGLDDIPHPVVEVTGFYPADRLDALRDPVASERQKGALEDITAYADKMAFFTPIIGRDIEIDDNISRILIEMQLQANFNIITVLDPKYGSSPEEFERRIISARKQIDDTEQFGNEIDIFPILRLDMPYIKFVEKMKIITDNGIKGIILMFSPYYNARANYLHIRELSQKKEKLFIHLSNVTKLWHINKKTSLMHALLPFGIDSYSPKAYRYFGNVKIVKRAPKRFHSKTWGVLDVNEIRGMDGDDLGCRCPVDRNIGMDSFLKQYYGTELLKHAIKAHDAFDGLREFYRSREAAIEDEFRRYVKAKKYGSDAVKGIFKIDVNQSTLRGM